MTQRVIVTGGAGFIGSAVVRLLMTQTDAEVAVLDCLTYAGNMDSLVPVSASPRFHFYKVDISDKSAVAAVFESFRPTGIMHLAAESHVDRSIDGPGAFIQTNVIGTFNLLDVARFYWQGLPAEARKTFRFHHISTDEVYGDLTETDPAFTELHRYEPSSPYSASKAASDHLVRAWHRTYGLPVVVTNCSNNYGPYHFPEKLIPHMILNAIHGRPLPVYGDGRQIRDWLYVEDHARALWQVFLRGSDGETYNIGGNNERRNIEVVTAICHLLEELAPAKPAGIVRYDELITYVKDRPGHDRRYAIDASKMASELQWTPQETFETGIRKTVQWYLDNSVWWQRVLSGDYQLQRLG